MYKYHNWWLLRAVLETIPFLDQYFFFFLYFFERVLGRHSIRFDSIGLIDLIDLIGLIVFCSFDWFTSLIWLVVLIWFVKELQVPDSIRFDSIDFGLIDSIDFGLIGLIDFLFTVFDFLLLISHDFMNEGRVVF